MSRIHGYCRSALLLAAPLGLIFGLGVMSGVALADEPSSTLESIVVTAEKREENLQVVPVAVTAFTAQTLAEAHYQNIESLSGVAPGISVRPSPGGNNAPDVTMRGVYGSNAFASDSGIAFYIDGVYLSSTLGSDVDLADIERIEVLRGPQGTLFGRNAIAGAISIITREPTGKTELHQQLSFGNLNQFKSKTRFDSPSWGDFSFSLTYLHDQQDGDVRNYGGGRAWNYGPATNTYGFRTSPSTLGGHWTDSVLAALKYDSEAFKAVYRFNYQHKLFDPVAVGILTFSTGPGANAFLSSLFGSFYQAQNPTIRTPVSAQRPNAVNNWYSTPSLDTDQAHSITVTAPIGDKVNIKNLLAWRRYHFDTTNNLSGMGGIFSPLYPPPNVAPLLPIENDTQGDQNSFQEELDVNIDTQWVHSTIGYLHYFSHDIEGGLPNVLNAPYGNGLFPSGGPAYINFVAQATPGVLLNDVHLTSDAIYTQNEIHIIPKLDLVLGARGTSDHRGGLDNSPTPAAPGAPVTYNSNTPTYLIGFNYQLSDDIFTYVKWSTAYISGGRIANVPFNKETANSYEAGIKSDLLDHKLRVNLALFTVDYKGVQVLTNPAQGCRGIPGISVYASQCIVNGGNERATGAEVEVSWVPVEGLTVGGNLSYTHISLSDVPQPLLAVDGSYHAVFLPSWTGQLSAQYRGPDLNALGDMDLLHGTHVTGRIEADYVSNANGSTPNSTAAVAQATQIPARTIINGRLGLAGFQIGSGEGEIALFARNLTNNKAINYDFNSAANIPVNFQPARTYGIDLLVSF
jgi:iron complex outermembrane receptor protein